MRHCRLWILALMSVWLALPASPSGLDADALFERAKNLNPGLQDYAADMSLALDAKVSFVPYKPKLKGTYYYKKPDKNKVELEKAPGFLKRYPNIYGFNLPNLEKYNARVVGREKLNGEDCHHVELIPKVFKSDVRRVDVWIHSTSYTVLRHQTTYAKEGLLTVDTEFQTVDGYLVLKGMRAVIHFPSASMEATARAQYSNYRFNQNLPDSLFSSRQEG